MVEKQELVRMLIEALSFEEITVSGRLQAFLREVKGSELDEMAKSQIERKFGRMLEESIRHSEILTEMVKRVMKSEQDEF